MNYPVIVRAESAHQYVAQPLGIPEVKVVAATEAEAIAQVTEALGHWLAAAKVIHVKVSVEEHVNPWLDAFGRSANDPDFAEFLEELQRLRTRDMPA
jgi:predicted RNase H-like HicB family nuclease